MSTAREFDVVVWGASGFTGRLVAEYLFQNYGTGGELKWAMAGRNQGKLEEVRAEVADDSVPMIIADSHDVESLAAMVKQTKVIATTVGPYAKYGTKLVEACVEHQTHYCDLAGEVYWMRQMIDAHHETAQAKGVKIVHTCGFDSIPSDMGVHFIQKEAKSRTGQLATKIKMYVKAMSGKMSGGTYASLNNSLEQIAEDKSIIKIVGNPYSLNPKAEMSGPDRRDSNKVFYDKEAKSWIYPFIMARINTRVVRRSNALSNYAYGKDFRYSEAMMSGDGVSGRLKAVGNTAALGMLVIAKPGTFLKRMLDKGFPKPGEGPNKTERENGFYNLRFYCTLADGSKMLAKVTGDRDPGYGSTSKMLAESAICLAKDDLPAVNGVLTPAIAMGDALLGRLKDKAGLTFTIVE